MTLGYTTQPASGVPGAHWEQNPIDSRWYLVQDGLEFDQKGNHVLIGPPATAVTTPTGIQFSNPRGVRITSWPGLYEPLP